MSNGSDVAMWALPQGDACPSLATIQAALAASTQTVYPKQGDTLYPGVTLADAINGLVALDPAMYGDKVAGQLFCAAPTIASVAAKSKAAATIEWNCASAKMGDQGEIFYVRVCNMVTQDSTSRPWIPTSNWIANAWSVGDEFREWPAALDHIKTSWQLPK